MIEKKTPPGLRNKLSSLKLSIVILNYHSLDMVRACLDSLDKHRPQLTYEIIVANNDEDTHAFNEFSAKNPDIHCIQNTGNWGFSSGCNLGASIANHNYLLFLNPDTKITDSPAIDRMINILEMDNDIGICGCQIIGPNGSEKPLYWNNPWFFIKWIKAIYETLYKRKLAKKFSADKDIWYPDLISGAVLAIRTKDFNRIGGWSDDKYWMYAEDRDLCHRMQTKLGKKLAQLRHYNIYHSWGGASENTQSMILDMEMIISRHNYIYHNSQGISRMVILFLYITKNLLSPSLKLFLNTILFRRNKITKYKLLTMGMIDYYLSAIKRKTWRSKRLDR